MYVDIQNPAGEGEYAGEKRQPRIRVSAMPGKHVAGGVMEKLNHVVAAIPPTNGWMLELGYGHAGRMKTEFDTGYRTYISGDTLMVDELREIPRRYAGQNIDLMLAHLGGTTVPTPGMGIMVTMDAEQGVELMRLVGADVTIPVHYDDYDVFASSLGEFREVVEKAGMGEKVVYLDRGEAFSFRVRD